MIQLKASCFLHAYFARRMPLADPKPDDAELHRQLGRRRRRMRPHSRSEEARNDRYENGAAIT